jgi:tRNA dimethylallyltransferase
MISIYEKAIFIIGSTAVGKTKLGIDIARHIDGEIISSDSMQLYQKASLMTAKPTAEEQSLARHHLIDVLPITTTNFTVRDYQQLALRALEDITSRNKIPVFVGGTMYYIESVLYDRVFSPGESATQEIDDDEILEKIKELDEDYLLNSDYRNPRHLRNAYNYIAKTGSKVSEKSTENKLRFKKTVVIWLHCDIDVLESRVRARIENMINNGGLEEIKEILAETHSDYTKGVLQSIGYKEFEPYIADPSKLQDCINNLVTATLQYSKRQIRWINNRMVPYLKINLINTNEAHNWEIIKNAGISALDIDVSAQEVTFSKLEAKDCDLCGVRLLGKSEWDQHIKSRRHKKTKDKDFSDDDLTRNCEVCERVFQGKLQWSYHIRSKKHLKRDRLLNI